MKPPTPNSPESGDSSVLRVWDEDLPFELLSGPAGEYLRTVPGERPKLNWLWEEMDRVWDELSLDNNARNDQEALGEYYSHPVWILNGIFSASDPISTDHRVSIATFLREKGKTKIADYGGGFGALAQAISRASPDADISIIEPFPSRVGINRLSHERRIRFLPKLENGSYDAVVAQDVLEHVEDPVKLAFEIAAGLQDGGLAIFANSFFPVIKCHLPCTFHLRHTFSFVMRRMGLEFLGNVSGASHAQIFLKTHTPSLPRARSAEGISRRLGPWLNRGSDLALRIRDFARNS